MATTEGPARPHDRHGRRRPFSSWMKRLTNLKSSSDSNPAGSSNKRLNNIGTSKAKKGAHAKNNPYPLSGNVQHTNSDSFTDHRHLSFSEPTGSHRLNRSHSEHSLQESSDGGHHVGTSSRSNAPTLSTNADTALSDAAHSKAGTTATAGVLTTNGGGEGSTFSSPAPSVRSLATTLTTVQSTAPSAHIYGGQNAPHHTGGVPYASSHGHQPSLQFSHQFPPSPVTAVPPHLAHHGNPTTYNTATANNLLTDNASLLTLASSSKRRRRNSLDTNASVRALAPSSVFGGSRESLPLSVLSGNVVEPSSASTTNAPGIISRPSIGGLASTERASVYSSSGTAPLANGDRGSFHASKTAAGAGDGASVRSGLQSHARNDSFAGSTAHGVTSPLTATVPTSGNLSGRASRRSLERVEVPDEDTEEEKSPNTLEEKESMGEHKEDSDPVEKTASDVDVQKT